MTELHAQRKNSHYRLQALFIQLLHYLSRCNFTTEILAITAIMCIKNMYSILKIKT